MNITSIHHAQVSIPKGAEAEARSFYCGLLGLPEVEKPDSLKGRGGFWVQAGGVQVHFGIQDGVDRNNNRAHLAYMVDDIAAWRARLTEAGFQPEDNVRILGFERFEMRDPFGNRLEFIQRTD